jgi:hypothetical protein
MIDLTSRPGHNVQAIELVTEYEIFRLEYGQRRKAQIREPRRQQKTDVYHVGPLLVCSDPENNIWDRRLTQSR